MAGRRKKANPTRNDGATVGYPGDTVFVNMAPDGKLELSLEPEPMSVH